MTIDEYNKVEVRDEMIQSKNEGKNPLEVLYRHIGNGKNVKRIMCDMEMYFERRN